MTVSWSSIISITLNADGGWTGYTARNIIPSSVLTTGVGKTYFRATFEAGGAGGLTVASAYVGQKADSGDPFDFHTTPVQLKFLGSNGFTISASQTIVSDTATFTIPSGKDIIISMYVTSGYLRQKASLTGYELYYLAANEPGTVNTSGYTNSPSQISGINLIEAGDDAASGRVIWF